MHKAISKILIFITLAVLFFVTRLESLNSHNVYDDNFSWLYRINYYPWIVAENLRGHDLGDRDLRYAGTISYHPGVTIMTMGGVGDRVGKKVFQKLHGQTYEQCAYLDYECESLDFELAIAKISIILFAALIIFISVYFIEKIFGLLSSLIWWGYITYEPIIFSSSIDLHLDFTFGILVSLAVIFVLYYFLKSQRMLFLILAGIAFGLALLTRFTGVFLIPWFALIFLSKGINMVVFKRMILFVFIALGTFVIFYPSMWVAPISTVQYIILSSREITDNDSGKLPFIIRYWDHIRWYVTTSGSLSVYYLLGLVAAIFVIFRKISSYKLLCLYALGPIIYILLIAVSDKMYVRYIVPSAMLMTVPISVGLSVFYFYISRYVKQLGIDQLPSAN